MVIEKNDKKTEKGSTESLTRKYGIENSILKYLTPRED